MGKWTGLRQRRWCDGLRHLQGQRRPDKGRTECVPGPSAGAATCERRTDHYEEIASIVFKYIELLKSTPPQEWAFKEAAMLGEMEFRFQDKAKPANYATHLCSELHKPYPREWLLSAPYLWRSFDRDQIAGALSNLSVDNCRVTVSSQQPLPGFEYDHKEQWYGTQYAIAPLPSVLLEVRSASLEPFLNLRSYTGETTTRSGSGAAEA